MDRNSFCSQLGKGIEVCWTEHFYLRNPRCTDTGLNPSHYYFTIEMWAQKSPCQGKYLLLRKYQWLQILSGTSIQTVDLTNEWGMWLDLNQAEGGNFIGKQYVRSGVLFLFMLCSVLTLFQQTTYNSTSKNENYHYFKFGKNLVEYLQNRICGCFYMIFT